MMGFDGMGMTVPWLFGALALAAIWAGVWWMLTAIGMNPGQHGHRPPPQSLPERSEPQTWQQPGFAATDAARQPTSAEPHLEVHSTQPESDYR